MEEALIHGAQAAAVADDLVCPGNDIAGAEDESDRSPDNPDHYRECEPLQRAVEIQSHRATGHDGRADHGHGDGQSTEDGYAHIRVARQGEDEGLLALLAKNRRVGIPMPTAWAVDFFRGRSVFLLPLAQGVFFLSEDVAHGGVANIIYDRRRPTQSIASQSDRVMAKTLFVKRGRELKLARDVVGAGLPGFEGSFELVDIDLLQQHLLQITFGKGEADHAADNGHEPDRRNSGMRGPDAEIKNDEQETDDGNARGCGHLPVDHPVNHHQYGEPDDQR